MLHFNIEGREEEFIMNKYGIFVSLFITSCLLSGCANYTTGIQNQNSTKSEVSTKSKANEKVVVTDMAGRKVNLPDNIEKVSAIHPIPSHMVWRLAPNKLASIDNQFKDRLLFMSDAEAKRLTSLPITGTFNTGDMSREQMLTIKPDIIVSLTKDVNLDKEQDEYAAPVLATSKNSLTEYEESWRFLGKVVGNEKEGNELADYWHNTITKVTANTSIIPEKEKLKVYYAQPKILTTVGSQTIMASIIREAGGINLFDTIKELKDQAENESVTVSMEQVLMWNPDVIIAKSTKARDEILSDTQWKNITAVKNKRVYASLKYEMLDRIQSLMGLVWTANTLYPDKVKLNLENEVRVFYSKVYLHENISNELIQEELK